MRLPALEKNILVYRALQMTLFLFYAEELRNKMTATVGQKINHRASSPLKGEKLIKAIFRTLEAEGCLSADESREIGGLFEYRNSIANEIQELTADIEMPGRNYRFGQFAKRKYDYLLLERAKFWSNSIYKRLSQRYVLTVGLSDAMFEAAEHALTLELGRLHRKIDKQFIQRNAKVKKA